VAVVGVGGVVVLVAEAFVFDVAAVVVVVVAVIVVVVVAAAVLVHLKQPAA